MGKFDDAFVFFDEVRTATPKAVLYIAAGEEHWLPKSQIRRERVLKRRDGTTRIEVTLPQWLADTLKEK